MKNTHNKNIKLTNGSKIAIIGGGPAGSFFAHFLMRNTKRLGLKNIEVDIYDKKDFTKCGPKGCNNCGGIIAESLVQEMALDGIQIPKNVLKEGIDAYTLHTDVGSIAIETPLQEKRIAAIYRGAGPLKAQNVTWESFDNFLRKMVLDAGANLIAENVKSVKFDEEGKPVIVNEKEGTQKQYDLLVGAVGVNSNFLDIVEGLEFGYKAPIKTKTKISEIYLGKERVDEYFGSSMHVFLLNIPKLRFAAIIPKGGYVTIALLSSDKIDQTMMEDFLTAPAVKNCFPDDIDLLQPQCQCSPGMNVGHAIQPYTDRVVLIGDCSSAKLYKNGIGAAYITAREAAETATLNGISKDDFGANYADTCSKIDFDNKLGGIVFKVTGVIQKFNFLKRAVLKVVESEQSKDGHKRHMSMVLWDTFTGSSSYKDIFLRALNPNFIFPFLGAILTGKNFKVKKTENLIFDSEEKNTIGRTYFEGDEIITEGATGECMYIIQSGKVAITDTIDNKEVLLAKLGTGEYFGDMALVSDTEHLTSAHSVGESVILTIDKKHFFNKIGDDPFKALDLLEKLSNTIAKYKNINKYSGYVHIDNECVGDTFEEEEDIPLQDNYMYMIEYGEIQITHTINGIVQKVEILKEGTFFNELSLFGYNVNTTSAKAVSTSEIRTIETKQELKEIFQHKPKLALQLMEKMFKRMKEVY